MCTTVHSVHICMKPLRGDVSNKIRCKAPRNGSTACSGNHEFDFPRVIFNRAGSTLEWVINFGNTSSAIA